MFAKFYFTKWNLKDHIGMCPKVNCQTYSCSTYSLNSAYCFSISPFRRNCVTKKNLRKKQDLLRAIVPSISWSVRCQHGIPWGLITLENYQLPFTPTRY